MIADLEPVLLASYQPHTVEVACMCRTIDGVCVMEKYISDIRILQGELQRLRRRLESIARLAEAD